MREATFCDSEGRAYRMDRVVVDPDGIHIVDYKTGAEEADPSQVREYIRILRDVFPGRPVRGVLAYVDRRAWETVE